MTRRKGLFRSRYVFVGCERDTFNLEPVWISPHPRKLRALKLLRDQRERKKLKKIFSSACVASTRRGEWGKIDELVSEYIFNE